MFHIHWKCPSNKITILRVGVSIGLDMVSIEISISTPKKSQSRPSRKSRRFSKVSLDDRDKVSISLDWSRPSRPPGLNYIENIARRVCKLCYCINSFVNDIFKIFLGIPPLPCRTHSGAHQEEGDRVVVRLVERYPRRIEGRRGLQHAQEARNRQRGSR